MKRVGIYIRVSTEEQAKEGYSIPAQIKRLNAFCESQDWTVVDRYIDDGISAKYYIEKRKELKRLLDDVKQGAIDIVLVWRLDRIVRSSLHLELLLLELEKHNVAFKSATEIYDTSSPSGRLFITLAGAMAQWERESNAERTVSGIEEMVNSGERPGAPAPYGYVYSDGLLVENADQSKIVKDIFAWYVSGLGLVAITTRLNKSKIPSPTGSTWHHNYIRYMLRNPVYIGKIRWRDIIEQGEHKPIIDEFTFKKAQQIIKDRKHMAPAEFKGKHPLTGTLVCGKCGSKMSGKIHHANTNHRKVYYRCRKRIKDGTCDMPYIKQEEFEPQLIEYIDKVINDIEELKKAFNASFIPEKDNQTEELERELEKLQKQKKKWYDLFSDPNNPIPKEDIFTQLQPLLDREKVIYEVLDAEKSDMDYELIPLEDLQEEYRNFRERWDQGEFEQRKQLMKDLFNYIRVNEDYTVDLSLRIFK